MGAAQATDPKKAKEFRKEHDVRVPQKQVGQRQRQTSLPIDKFAFGKPNRPSTPIQGVISNFYGESAEHDQKDKYDIHYQLKKQVRALPEPKETEAQKKAKEFIKTKRLQPEQEKKEFKLKRF